MRAKEFSDKSRIVAQILVIATMAIVVLGIAFIVIVVIGAPSMATTATALISAAVGLGIGSALLIGYQADLHRQWHEEWVTIGDIEVIETLAGARVVNLTVAGEHAPTVMPYSLTYATRIANLHVGQTIMIVRRSTSFSSIHCEGRLV